MPRPSVVTSIQPGALSHEKTETILIQIQQHLTPEIRKKFDCTYRFDVSDSNGKYEHWLLDLREKTEKGVTSLCEKSTKADCTIQINDQDFVEMLQGNADPLQLFMKQRLKVKGNIALAQKLTQLRSVAKSGPNNPEKEQPKVVKANAVSSSQTEFAKSQMIFDGIQKRLSPDIVSKISVIYRFDITSNGKSKSWIVDLKSTEKGAVKQSTNQQEADCIIIMNEEDFFQLMTGKLNAQKAFLTRKLKIKGNVMAAQKLSLLQGKKSKL